MWDSFWSDGQIEEKLREASVDFARKLSQMQARHGDMELNLCCVIDLA